MLAGVVAYSLRESLHNGMGFGGRARREHLFAGWISAGGKTTYLVLADALRSPPSSDRWIASGWLSVLVVFAMA